VDRIVVWYSDGAASAVAAKLAVEKYGERCEVVKCDTTSSEHPDNLRFRAEVEAWIGRRVVLIRNEKYADVDEVFEKRRYMAGISGAVCTTELKKLVRLAYQRPDDVHVFGYTADEHNRARDFAVNNPELTCDWILCDRFIRKQDCLRMLKEAGIALPQMYALGFEHNNCLGCVKATSPAYWNRVRMHFPEVFKRRAEQSREIGVRLTRVQGRRIFLDQLGIEDGGGESDGDIECGPFCEMQNELDLGGAA
jgi:PP-loop superfamily ATP-utilizing enzyme